MAKLKTVGLKFAQDGGGIFITDKDISTLSLRIQAILQQTNPQPQQTQDLLADIHAILEKRQENEIIVLHSIKTCTDQRTMRRIMLEQAIKQGGLPLYKMTKESLFERIWFEAKKNDEQAASEILEYCADPSMSKYNLAREEFHNLLSDCLHDIIDEAWAQVDFGTENLTINPEDGCGLGYQEIDGYTFIGVNAFNDGEVPVYFVVYWDGKNLRAYVPQEGNCFDQDTRTAFYEDCEEYKEWLENMAGQPLYQKMIDEIKDRFVVKDR